MRTILSAHGLGKAIEDMPVQRFLRELQEQVLGECVGRRIIAVPNVDMVAIPVPLA